MLHAKSQFMGHVPGSTADLRRTVVPIAHQFRVISFDIFDTLVERLVAPPDQVKRLAALQLRKALDTGTSTMSIESILKMRDLAETELRGYSAASGLDHECRFSELAQNLAERLLADPSVRVAAEFDAPRLRESIIACEIDAETRALRAKSGMPELLEELKLAGCRIIAVSDMYLDGSMIRELLKAVGFAHQLDAIYVSADHSRGKYSGRLFQHVLEAELLVPAELLHIGDNALSDYQIPLAAGASAVLFSHAEQLPRQHINQTYKWLSDRNPYWRGHHLFSGLAPVAADDFFFRYGFSVLGPIYATFVACVREALIADGIEHAFFLARDGDLFHRIFGVFDDPSLGLSPAPEASYLHLSRKAVALPAAHAGLNIRHVQRMLPRMQQCGLAAMARALSLEPESLSTLAQRLGLSSVSQPIDPQARDWPLVLTADEELQDLVRCRAREARELLRGYLQQQGFFGANRKIALIDIGWNGSIQRGLKDTFGDGPDWPIVTGYYLSFNDNLGHELNDQEARGILFDKRQMHPRDNVFEHFEEIFENGARALDATTVGYRRLANGAISPIFLSEDASDRHAERMFNPLATSLRSGALACASHFAQRYGLYGYQASDLHPYVLELARRAVFFPTIEEANQLFSIVHAEDAGTGSILDFSAHRLSGPCMLFRPFTLMRLILRSDWKYGTARSLRIHGFNHLLRLAHLVVIARQMRSNRRKAFAEMPKPHWWEFLLLKAVEHKGMPWLLRARALVRRLQ